MNKINLKSLTLLMFILIFGFTVISINQNLQKNSQKNSSIDKEYRSYKLQSKLRCPSCAGITLDLCELPICREMKKSINIEIAKGSNDEAIINFFQVRYGDEIVNQTNKSIYLIFIIISTVFLIILFYLFKNILKNNNRKE
ncbi:MAG: cytochrome c-type biogenesis protein CcmH [Dehalococcoidia bacterium]|jgi:cytochrome c-type biogenesis protein CcmH/NrfF|nr:cytochrome c-type biogenesis protein CcmH [Dehalococcoidia bacterium]